MVVAMSREQLMAHDAVVDPLAGVLSVASTNDRLSGDHFSVDVTLIHFFAGSGSFACKDGGNDEAGSLKVKISSDDIHNSTTEALALLYRKRKTASELRVIGHTLRENRHGLLASAVVTTVDGHADRDAAKLMITEVKQVGQKRVQMKLGANKGYNAVEFIEALTQMMVLHHAALNTSGRKLAVPDRVAKGDGYAISQQKPMLIEQLFGFTKFINPIRQAIVRGVKKVDHLFVLSTAVYNLARIHTLAKVRLLAK